MYITQEDIDKYLHAQKIKTVKCNFTQSNVRQTRYGYYRWKESKLPIEKYLYIADNEELYVNVKKG